MRLKNSLQNVPAQEFSRRLRCFSGSSLAALINAGCWCFVFLTKIVNHDMVAAVAMRCEHLPDGSIQWLLVGNVPRIAPLHLHGDQNHQCLTCMLCCHQLVDGHSKKTCYGFNKLKARYNIFLIVVINLFVLYKMNIKQDEKRLITYYLTRLFWLHYFDYTLFWLHLFVSLRL